MTSYQRARRIATWRGSFIALTFCTGWLLLSAGGLHHPITNLSAPTAWMAREIRMSAEKELIVAPPQETALAVYSAEKGLEPWLQQIRVKIDEFLAVVPDLKTVKGRKEIASMAYEVARTKTAIENKGK